MRHRGTIVADASHARDERGRTSDRRQNRRAPLPDENDDGLRGFHVSDS
jgi:hypothetical protein